MNRAQVIQLIEHELVQADEATNEQQFEKHMYAIHTLTSIYANDVSKTASSKSQGQDFTNTVATSLSKVNQSSNTSSSQGKSKVTAAEIEAMGGKVPDSMKSSQNNSLPSNTMVTDDEIGNGESIFDF
ncbi:MULTISPECIES: DUF5327 family protein [Staphylococcus]|uniref:YwdI family protein n=1 Tax=Staphylococcus haemolyticus TaxID=1283 RepID=A0A7Z1SEF4_STAHA|nr:MULTISPECIES: DUF5327 family protein [Staphylococcus]MCH4337353.1 YwdI family protein [Staphylococcus haemolyticus]MCH4347965.1 YwdI family protein [Staphylococcus haemolyticus]MCH4350113.1 YwdI family protein [Staphylococcus haemolyticus]MCH4359091.1 YwdI family protein [Staphylococcus haemolyticus]MCH4380826.1 YwdI family protein [Staphylococcus haemolyticus]